MKLIGLYNKSLQYVFLKLYNKVDISFPNDLRSSDLLLCNSFKLYKKYAFENIKIQNKYKVVIFLDTKNVLKRIKGLQIIEDITPSFIDYIKSCSESVLKIRYNYNYNITEKLKDLEKTSFFSKILYPLWTNALKNKKLKNDVIKSVALTIKNIIIKNNNLDIEQYKDYIVNYYYNNFINWLETEEAKNVCYCLINKKSDNKYNFNQFEINYLLNKLNKED